MATLKRAFKFVSENKDGTPLFDFPYFGLFLVLIGIGYLIYGFLG